MAPLAPQARAGRSELAGQRDHWRPPPGERRQVMPQDSFEWLHAKRLRDRSLAGVPENLWLIHGKLYDLTGYLHRHPGGPDWLELTRGTDATAAFEIHHLDEVKVNAILPKYFVRDAAPEHAHDAEAYDWSQTGFYKSLKRDAFELLKAAGGWGPTWQMHACNIAALVGFLLCFAATCLSGSFLWATATGFMVFGLMGVGHNAFHQSNGNLWRYAFDLSMFSSHHWRVSHALSHHMFPNLDLDTEASQVEPHVFFMRNQPINHAFVTITWHVTNFVLGPIEFTRRLLGVARGTEAWRHEYALCAVQPLILLLVGNGLWSSIALWVFFQGVGMYLLLVVSTPVHRSVYGWTEGCQEKMAAADDFGHHTALATNDYSVQANLLCQVFLFGGFNDHVTHHLFPTVDMSKQHLLRSLFLAKCKEFGIDYELHPFSDLFIGTVRAMTRSKGTLAYSPPRPGVN